MAQAGMTRWRATNTATEGNTSDEVQKSLELLDQVLSEFDDLEGGGGEEEGGEGEGGGGGDERCASAPLTTTSTPDEELESPSLGHTSEDDGYMSMNGRRNKLLLNLTRNNNVPDNLAGAGNLTGVRDCPPPPEEAQRIIANLLPRVSPCNTASKKLSPSTNKYNNRVSNDIQHFSNQDSLERKTNTSTQTTLPKTRHQRPYGWENGVALPPLCIEEVEPAKKFGSLPCDGLNHYRGSHGGTWLPPRTNPCVGEKHREVRRAVPAGALVDSLARCETTDDDDNLMGGGGGNFSDDSLEDIPLPSTPSGVNKRHSIAWEVPLSPGSTRVVGRRRRKSATDHSSTGSISRTSQNLEEWPDPPNDNDLSFLSNALPADLNSTGTYVIRRGRKRPSSKLGGRSPGAGVKGVKHKSSPRAVTNNSIDLKRYSSTFDNIKSLLKDGKVDGLDETPPDFPPPTPPGMTRGSSLPSLIPQSGYPGGLAPYQVGLMRRPDFISSSLENIVDSDLDYKDSDLDYKDSSSLENMLIDRLRQSGDEEFDSLDSRINEGLSELSSCGDLTNARLSIFDADNINLQSVENPVSRSGGIQKCESHTSTTDLNTNFSSTDDIDISEPPPVSKTVATVEKVDIAIQVEPSEIVLEPSQPTSCQSVQVDQRLDTETHSSLSCQTEENRTQDSATGGEDVMVYSSESFVDKEDPEYIRLHAKDLSETNDQTRSKTKEQSASNEEKNDPRIPTPDYPTLPSFLPEKVPTPDYPKQQAFFIPAYREKVPAEKRQREPDNKIATSVDKRQREPSDRVPQINHREKLPTPEEQTQREPGDKIPTPDYSKDEMDSMPRVPRVESSRQKCARGNLKLQLHTESEAPVWNQVNELPTSQTIPVGVKETPLTARQENGLGSCRSNSRENTSMSSFKGPSPTSKEGQISNGSLPGSKNSLSRHSQPRQNEGGDFNVNVEVIHHHEFGPLPPSPVEEDDEFHDTVPQPPLIPGGATDSPYYRGGGVGGPEGTVPHASASLKTRSMDAGFSRNFRNQQHASRKDVPPERRTLPTDLPGPSRRRGGGAYVKRGSLSPRGVPGGPESSSCSLPETPLFSRGCDIPRTPHRRAPDVPTMTRTAPRPGGGTLGGGMGTYRPTMMGHGSAIALEQAMVGAELLRMQGPGRGWYPRHRQPRPASVEHLDRLATHPGGGCHPMTTPVWDSKENRKPCTLPPNLSPPKFFHRGPRDALRRVTSLLIRGKGSNNTTSKENGTKKDGMLTSSVIGPHGDTLPDPPAATRPPKRGFFRSFWKRSRHYSLEQQ